MGTPNCPVSEVSGEHALSERLLKRSGDTNKNHLQKQQSFISAMSQFWEKVVKSQIMFLSCRAPNEV